MVLSTTKNQAAERRMDRTRQEVTFKSEIASKLVENLSIVASSAAIP